MTPLEVSSLIYSVYPRHVGRDAAIKAIERATKRLSEEEGVTPDEARRTLYMAAKRYSECPLVQYRKSRNEMFLIPHPSTFFNQTRYLDDPAEWEAPQERQSDANSLAFRRFLEGGANSLGTPGLGEPASGDDFSRYLQSLRG